MPSIETNAGEFLNSLVTAFQSQTLTGIARFLLVLVGGIFVIRISMKLLNKMLLKYHFMHDSLDNVIRAAVKFILYFVLSVTCAGVIGIPISSFLALFSVVALAISLAIQGLLSNVAGGILVMTVKPVRVDDFVQINDLSGSVKQIGMMHTRLLTPDGKMVFVPNSMMNSSCLINYTINGRRRVDLPVSAGYEFSPDEVEVAIMDAVNLLRADQQNGILADPQPAVLLESYGDNSINYTVRLWTETSKWYGTKMKLNREIYAAFKRNHVEMSYPHVNVHFDKNQ